MDIFTPALCLVLPGLAGALYYVATFGKRKREAEARIETTRIRADARVRERAFADTESAYDPYRSSLSFHSAVEVDDSFDGRGALTDSQAAVISLIFDGFRPTAVQTPKNIYGGTAHTRAGVPRAQSIFDDCADLVGPEDTWLNTAGTK